MTQKQPNQRRGMKPISHMTKEELKKRVDEIIAMSADAESAHSEEDKLHVELLIEYLPTKLLLEVARLEKADFPRWCA